MAEVLRPKPAVCRCESHILFQAKTQIISAGEYGISAPCTKATALTKRCSMKSKPHKNEWKLCHAFDRTITLLIAMASRNWWSKGV